ncbi:MAG: MerR family transcriptional regulator [Gammaproteobacteria bacterium]|nr:MerR family transcriptional regulator [Gammaproteobacteria bacterium]MDP2346453.1 MerR family transcriptional regulator [Gammaproteobacteria bacterium]
MNLSIGKFAEAGKVGVETIRFYQRKGLLDTPRRGEGLRRYDAMDLRRLRFIRSAKAAGFTLEEIKELIALDSSHDRHRARQLALSRITELETKIAELQRAHLALKRLAKQCGEAESGPCPILESFDL